MELYILDGLLRRTRVIDEFESLIWTERWSEAGEFELELKSNLQNRSDFLVGAHLALNTSYRVMKVDTVENRVESDGKEVLSVTGRSLESLLEDRIVKFSMADTETDPSWVINDTPVEVVRTMFDHICRAPGGLSTNDEIPFLQAGSIFTPGTIPEPTSMITWDQDPDTLYSAVKRVCELYDLGFRLVRHFDFSELYFDVYTGNDRTTKQSALSPVIFSPGLDNVQDTKEFVSNRKSKNVAYVFSSMGSLVVYSDNVDASVSGFDRRVLLVNARVDSEEINVNGVLEQTGYEALQDHRPSSLFDGEINQQSEYTYGVDYNLGDLVEMRNKDGVVTYKRVTEQIFVADTNGERSYPTLSQGDFVDEDTWLSWSNNNTTWNGLTGEVWADI